MFAKIKDMWNSANVGTDSRVQPMVGKTEKTRSQAAQIISLDVLVQSEVESLTSSQSDIWDSVDHNRREYVHSFFQYPAMMVPILQKRLVDVIIKANPSVRNVIDPFMGSATSLVACMQNGLNCYGQDLNPLALLIAKTRTGPYYVDALKTKHKAVRSAIHCDQSTRIEIDFKGLGKWFKNDVAVELSRIVRAIRKENRVSIRRFYWTILSEVIRLSSNDRTSTYKLHARPAEEIRSRDISPILLFENHLAKSIIDLEHYRDVLLEKNRLSKGAYRHDVKLSLLDSRIRINRPEGQLFDLLITSPPYGDNKTTVTYGQHSYLPLQWIDFNDIDAKADRSLLNTTLEIDTRSIGGKIKQLPTKELEGLYSKSHTFKNIHRKLISTDIEKSHKVVTFFNDLVKVIGNVFEVMKDDSYQIWTIGNRTVAGITIPNNKILIELIEHYNGVTVSQIERNILNKRMAKRNKNSSLVNKEDILIFRKNGKAA